MKMPYALLLAAAGAPPAVSAPADQPAPQPYRSTFAAYQRQPEPGQTPDQYWLQANRTVAGSGHAMGHMGHTDQTGHGTAGHDTMKRDAMDHSKMHHGKQPDAAPPPAQHQHKEH